MSVDVYPLVDTGREIVRCRTCTKYDPRTHENAHEKHDRSVRQCVTVALIWGGIDIEIVSKLRHWLVLQHIALHGNMS